LACVGQKSFDSADPYTFDPALSVVVRQAVQQEAAKHPQSSRPVEPTASAERGPDMRQPLFHAFLRTVFVQEAVDPDVGTIRVRRAVGAYGIGRFVNPRLARSQCTGGMIGGNGMALMDRVLLSLRLTSCFSHDRG
jgi:xanthine dehydrogenase YagR molybdenum-binding subunit